MSTGPRLHPVELSDEALLEGCEVRRLRRSGPGGQNRNKVETAVQLVHHETGLVAEANERRSQAENRRVALRRLRLQLALVIRVPHVPGTSPSALWQGRCREGRISINPEHADFPRLLAEALDRLAAVEWGAQEAADRLGCTTSQLVKFLALEPRALALVNRERVGRSLGRLH
jgi:hypothetical protein